MTDAVVHSMTRSSARSLLIELRHPGGVFPLYDAGAHIDVHLPGSGGDAGTAGAGDGPVIRQYSLVNPGDRRDRMLIAVSLDDSGRGGSRFIHERVRVGDRLRVSAPRNHFRLEAPAAGPAGATDAADGANGANGADGEATPRRMPPVVLLAGGIGVTPLVAMAEQLHREATDFVLHCFARSAGDQPLREYIAGRPWAPEVAWHLSEEGDSFRTSGLPGGYVDGARLYVCGPAGFIEAARRRAAESGWPEEAVASEKFAATASPAVPAADPAGTGDAAAPEDSAALGSTAGTADAMDTSFDVIAASTGEKMTVPSGSTIAEVLVAHGYPVELSCEQGICGSCITGVLDGTPDHRDEVQTPAEHAANTSINVCCSRASTPSLTLEV
ncbi:PDR/VanB family oxidoreductase [Corynebacterium sp. NPDC060344]|uniref:PDR/VanB family oxidoreductase n=1 Tax=Corynebacterium sp. NPDC060344 TaxID=3347101 RepID=UPI003667BDEE